MTEDTPPPYKWDARYAEPGWAFGTEPNDFLREMAPRVPRGRVLCLAEGEGRNAVYMAVLGYEVTAVDLSPVGVGKMLALAEARAVRVRAEVADLADYAIEPGHWQGIVSIFAHVPAEVRRPLHRAVVAGLAPGGVLVLEAYPPEQADRGTGGPSEASRFMTLAGLRQELEGLEFELERELDRDVIEGRYHTGRARVVQVVARRPEQPRG
jgi:SAM-dependent methyltransferase